MPKSLLNAPPLIHNSTPACPLLPAETIHVNRPCECCPLVLARVSCTPMTVTPSLRNCCINSAALYVTLAPGNCMCCSSVPTLANAKTTCHSMHHLFFLPCCAKSHPFSRNLGVIADSPSLPIMLASRWSDIFASTPILPNYVQAVVHSATLLVFAVAILTSPIQQWSPQICP